MFKVEINWVDSHQRRARLWWCYLVTRSRWDQIRPSEHKSLSADDLTMYATPSLALCPRSLLLHPVAQIHALFIGRLLNMAQCSTQFISATCSTCNILCIKMTDALWPFVSNKMCGLNGGHHTQFQHYVQPLRPLVQGGAE